VKLHLRLRSTFSGPYLTPSPSANIFAQLTRLYEAIQNHALVVDAGPEIEGVFSRVYYNAETALIDVLNYARVGVPAMNLTEADSSFLDAVIREFAFLHAEYGFEAGEPEWDGRAVLIKHLHPHLEIQNSLEAETTYMTYFTPLQRGRTTKRVDASLNKLFVDFELRQLVTAEDGTELDDYEKQYRDISELERAVARRATASRRYVPLLIGPDRGAEVGRVRLSVRERGLRVSLEQWRSFVSEIREGFNRGITAYVACINARGQIASYLKWPGAVAQSFLSELDLLDQEFDELTVPMDYGRKGGLFPLPNARRWWRLPEHTKGELREYFFRLPSDQARE
jgi:hypothetical protein